MAGSEHGDLAGLARQVLADRARALEECAHAVASAPHPEAVHDLRVACRRLGEAGDVFQPLVPARAHARLRRTLKRLRTGFGDVRDLEVMQERARGLLASLAGAEAVALEDVVVKIHRRLQRERAKAPRRVAELHVSGVERLAAAVLSAIDAPEPSAAPAYAAAVLREARERAADAEALLHAAEPEPLHRLRIALKRLRYRVESLASLAPATAKTVVEALKQRQDLLGSMQDLRALAARVEARREELRGRGYVQRADALDAVGARIEALRLEEHARFAAVHAELPSSTLVLALESKLSAVDG